VIWAVWAALAVAVLAPCGAGAFLGVRGLELWRRFTTVKRETVGALASLEESANTVAEKAERTGQSPELERSVARLRASVRRLNILRSALEDATGALGRVTAVYPRK
jgi:hypothetical protein